MEVLWVERIKQKKRILKKIVLPEESWRKKQVSMKLVLPEGLLLQWRLEDMTDARLTTAGILDGTIVDGANKRPVATDVDTSKLWESCLGTVRVRTTDLSKWS